MSDLKTEDLIKALGYDPEKIKTVDDFKTTVSTDFIRRDNVHDDPEITNKIVGKNLQQIEKAVVSHIKDLGVELTEDDFKEAKNTYDKIKVGMAKVKAFHELSTSELKQLAEKKGGDAAKEWQEKYGKAEQKLKDLETMNQTLAKQFEEAQNNGKNELKNYKITDAKNKAMSKAVFKDGLTDLERTGFQTIFDNKYMIDLDEKGDAFIFEKATNKRVPNPAVVNTFMNIEDVLKMEIEVNKLGKTNPHANATVVVQKDPFNVVQQNGKEEGLPINPRFYGNKK